MAIGRKFPEVVLSFGSSASNRAGSQGSFCLREIVGVGVLRDIDALSLKGDLAPFCSSLSLRGSKHRKRKKHLGSPAGPSGHSVLDSATQSPGTKARGTGTPQDYKASRKEGAP